MRHYSITRIDRVVRTATVKARDADHARDLAEQGEWDTCDNIQLSLVVCNASRKIEIYEEEE